jgi:hypothetical protein
MESGKWHGAAAHGLFQPVSATPRNPSVYRLARLQ